MAHEAVETLTAGETTKRILDTLKNQKHRQDLLESMCVGYQLKTTMLLDTYRGDRGTDMGSFLRAAKLRPNHHRAHMYGPLIWSHALLDRLF